MDCSEVREAVSALWDGEEPELPSAEVGRHLAHCAGCTTYRSRLTEVHELSRAASSGGTPDLAARIADSTPTTGATRPRARQALRLAVIATAAMQLTTSGLELAADHGYGAVDHASHESLSFTLALCVGLLLAAFRPARATAYAPVVGVAALLLIGTGTIDVIRGRAELLDELPHADLLVGFVLLHLLGRNESGGRGALRVPERPPLLPRATARLRLITRNSLALLHPSPVVLRRTGAAVGLAAVSLLISSPAWGHAVLEGSDPAPDATIAHLPASVTLRYDEAVTTLPTSLRVYGPDGQRVDDGQVTHPGGTGSEVAVGLTGSGVEGTYLISWRVISADSHPVSGAFQFSVGHRSAAPDVALGGNDTAVSLGLGASRWLGYVGATFLIGGTVFLLRCWPAGWSTPRGRRILFSGVGLIVVGAVAGVLLKGPYDADLGFGHVAQGNLLREVLSTTYGHGLVARILLAALALALVLTRRPRTWWWLCAAVTGVGLLATYAVTGHAVSGSQRPLAIASDMIHVGSMSVWLGGLLVLTMALLPSRDLATIGPPLARFSPLAAGCVAALVATGVYQSLRQVGLSWGAWTSTTYGRELLVKLGLVVIVLAAAVTSRSWVRRHLRPPVVAHAAMTTDAPTASTEPEAPSLRRVRWSVGIEAAVALLVLGVTAALVVTEPAHSAYHPSVSTHLTTGPDTVAVSAVPTGDRQMSVHLDVLDRQSQPSDPAQLTATASLPDQQIGPLPLTLTKAGRGLYRADLAVPVPGDWQLSVTVRTSAVDEYTAQVTLPIR